MATWILKTEPGAYSFDQLVAEKKTLWTGVRNFAARKHLREMKRGDMALIFHTGDEKRLVGLARVTGAPVDDPTSPGEDWTAVPLAAGKRLQNPVSLATLKATKALAGMPMLKQGRLSVSPVGEAEVAVIMKLAGG